MAKVLIIDDDSQYRDIVTEILNEAKIETVSAVNGEDALIILKNTPDIDLILLDIFMPQMDGLAFYYHLQNTILKKIPIMVLTNSLLTSYPDGIGKVFIKSNTTPDQILTAVQSYL
ncbi:MAG: response regulator [bacterium]|nr:response regulator [bacterium]